MEFPELIKSRRSIRKYKDKPVPIETIHELIKISTFAPNAGNEQPWKFIIVNNKEMLQRMSDESKKNILARIADNPNDYANCKTRSGQKVYNLLNRKWRKRCTAVKI